MSKSAKTYSDEAAPDPTDGQPPLGATDMTTPAPPNLPDAFLTEQEKTPAPMTATVEPVERAMTMEEQGITAKTPYPTGSPPEDTPSLAMQPTLKGDEPADPPPVRSSRR